MTALTLAQSYLTLVYEHVAVMLTGEVSDEYIAAVLGWRRDWARASQHDRDVMRAIVQAAIEADRAAGRLPPAEVCCWPSAQEEAA